jgi:hypothetical protein
MAVLLGLLVGVFAACEEQSPTSIDPDGVPVGVRTVEIEIPWSEVGARFQSFGGFGSLSRIGTSVVARDLGGLVDARTLVRFDTFPSGVAVRDSTGVLVTDTLITIRSGQLIVVADTAGTDSLTSWTFAAGVIDQEWDPRTATWDAAIDSVGLEAAWDEPGAGPVRSLGEETTVVGESGDSIRFDLDPTTLAEWADSVDSERSARLDLVSGAERVRVFNISLRLEIGSAAAPDTTVFRVVPLIERTFVYTPAPDAPEGVVRAGGAPSWRTVLGLDIPSQVEGPAELCEVAGCPFTLTSGSLSRASLVLRSRTTSPAAFQPVDSVLLDVRPVLAPAALPKSPLGASLVGQAALAPEAFGAAPGEPLEIPITNFVRAILDAEAGETPPTELAVLSVVEPLDLAFVEFDGPDDPGAPVLRLLVTVSDPVRYR